MKKTIAMCGLALFFALTALSQTLVYEARDYTRARINPAEPWTTATGTSTLAQLNINNGDEVEHRWTATGVTYCAGSWRSLFLAINSVDYSMPTASTDSVMNCGTGPTPLVTRAIRINVGSTGPGVVPFVQYPNGGEILTVGQTINILWSVTGNPTSQTIRFSGNGGASFLDIATVGGNLRSLAWTVPNIPTMQGLIRITATDGIAANSDDSNAVFTIRTGADSTPPTVNMLSPLNGQTVSGMITVSAAAFDNVAVAGVQFLLDGTNLGPELTQTPYQIGWNTASTSNGTHTLTARARDTSGYTNSASVTIIVNNAGAITFQVLVPVTGGSYPTGQQLNVAWQAYPNVVGYNVFFANDGANYVQLNAYVLRTTDTSFGWTPSAATTTGKIRIVATLPNGATATAESGIFTITGASAVPQFTANNVTSAATGDIRGVLTGGALFTIFGQNLAPAEAKALAFPLPTRLADTEVLVNGTAVPLLFVSIGQINFQAPNPLAPNTATIQVVNRASGSASQTVNLTVVSSAPALFLYLDGAATWRVIVQNHATSGLVTQSSPLSLALGQFIVLYGTGFGPTETMVTSGQPSPTVRLLNSNSTALIIDGNPQPGGSVEYIGLAPGMAGVFQTNLELPANLPTGQHDGVLVVNGKVMAFQFWTTR